MDKLEGLEMSADTTARWVPARCMIRAGQLARLGEHFGDPDTSENSKHLKEMDYYVRENIAAFLIPKQAFHLDKDQLLELYCDE